VSVCVNVPLSVLVVVLEEQISARRVRLKRQKTCRNALLCVWLLGLSIAAGILLISLLTQQSNSQLLQQIKDLKVQVETGFAVRAARREAPPTSGTL
jgi:hypothetical protein